MMQEQKPTDRTVIHPQLAGRRLAGALADPARLDDCFIERDIQAFFTTLLRYHSIAYGYDYPPPERYEQIVRTVPGLLSRALNQPQINLREVIRLAVTTGGLLYLHADYTPEILLDEMAKGLRV
jgi:hypothetical protein